MTYTTAWVLYTRGVITRYIIVYGAAGTTTSTTLCMAVNQRETVASSSEKDQIYWKLIKFIGNNHSAKKNGAVITIRLIL